MYLFIVYSVSFCRMFILRLTAHIHYITDIDFHNSLRKRNFHTFTHILSFIISNWRRYIAFELFLVWISTSGNISFGRTLFFFSLSQTDFNGKIEFIMESIFQSHVPIRHIPQHGFIYRLNLIFFSFIFLFTIKTELKPRK